VIWGTKYVNDTATIFRELTNYLLIWKNTNSHVGTVEQAW